MKNKLDWTPIRRGDKYCSPACGGGCKWSEYQATKKYGNRMLRLMRHPDQWRLVITENLGWFATLEHIASNGLLTVSISKGFFKEPRYFAMLSLDMPRAGDVRWADCKSFAMPQPAVNHVLKLAKPIIEHEHRQFALIMDAIA